MGSILPAFYVFIGSQKVGIHVQGLLMISEMRILVILLSNSKRLV